MTAPMTSREELLARVAEAIRLRAIERGHPIHPAVAQHLAAAALGAGPAQSPPQEPFLWICLVPGKWEPENIRAWTRDPDQAAGWVEQGLDMKALFASPVQSTVQCSCEFVQDGYGAPRIKICPVCAARERDQ